MTVKIMIDNALLAIGYPGEVNALGINARVVDRTIDIKGVHFTKVFKLFSTGLPLMNINSPIIPKI
jgi:hypothetical protein